MDETWIADGAHLRGRTLPDPRDPSVHKLHVLRPELPITGTVGFNDVLLSHSSPANYFAGDRPALGSTVAVMCDCNDPVHAATLPEPLPEQVDYRNKRISQCSLFRSHTRTLLEPGYRPDFLRTWFQKMGVGEIPKITVLSIEVDFLRFFNDYRRGHSRTYPIRVRASRGVAFGEDGKIFMKTHGDSIIQTLGGGSKPTIISTHTYDQTKPFMGIIARNTKRTKKRGKKRTSKGKKRTSKGKKRSSKRKKRSSKGKKRSSKGKKGSFKGKKRTSKIKKRKSSFFLENFLIDFSR